MDKRLLPVLATALVLTSCSLFGSGEETSMENGDKNAAPVEELNGGMNMEEGSTKEDAKPAYPIVLRGDVGSSHIAIAGKKGSVVLNQGKFNTFDFQVFLNPEKPDAFEVTQMGVGVLVSSLVTDNAGLTDNLLSANFLDPVSYPMATFVSTNIENTEGSRYHVTGEATVHGVTNEVSFDATITRESLEANLLLNIGDFGLSGMNDYDADVPMQISVKFQ